MELSRFRLVKNFFVKPALCLDLDGTVRKTISGKAFIEDPEDIMLMPGIENIIARYREHGFLILGFSNQAGVAHGFKCCEDVDQEIFNTLRLFKSNPFHLIKACYHDEKGTVYPFNHRSLLRKPDIGMLALAEEELFNQGIIVDWNKSMFVGDRPEDAQCAERANIIFYDIQAFLNMPHIFEI